LFQQHLNPKRPKPSKTDQLDIPAITPEIIAEWRAPRCGTTNPQRMNNPLWEWLVRRWSGERRLGLPPKAPPDAPSAAADSSGVTLKSGPFVDKVTGDPFLPDSSNPAPQGLRN
jgi:hypothetical protein